MYLTRTERKQAFCSAVSGEFSSPELLSPLSSTAQEHSDAFYVNV